MRNVWILVFLSSLPLQAQEGTADVPDEAVPENNQVYRSVGPGGVVEFSDKPGDNSEAIKVPKSQSYTAPPIPPSVAAPSSSPRPSQKVAVYKSLAITAPAHDSTIRNNPGNVSISISLEPALLPGHKLVVLLDGKPHPASGAQLELQAVDRGTHTLVAQVSDAKGRVLISSKPSTFHLHRHFIKRPVPEAPPPPTPAVPDNT